MNRIVECVWEHNGDDTLLYAIHAPGAYARGRSLGEALAKRSASRAGVPPEASAEPPEALRASG